MDEVERKIVANQLEDIQDNPKNQEQQEINPKTGFQKTEKFGYVNSSPLNLGAAMRFAMEVELPGWSHIWTEGLKKRCDELKLCLHVRSTQFQGKGN